jgi:membrane carboxypeptidase/penicillin-binding protein
MKKVLKWVGIVLLFGIAAFVLLIIFYPVPDPNEVAVAESSEVRYADGQTLIGQFGEVKRTSIPLSEVPLHTGGPRRRGP